jgi:hypothetical protein
MGTVRSKDGTTIAFDAWVDGQPLIMVDGAMPADAAAGVRQSPFWPALEAVAHTIAYDGRSWAPPCRAPRYPAIAGPRSPSPSWSCTAPAPSRG